MPVYKDKKNGTWYVSLWFTARDGSKKKKLKRGFATKHEAAEYERRFHNQELGKMEMTFSDFFQLYKQDIMPRLKLNTWLTKEATLICSRQRRPRWRTNSTTSERSMMKMSAKVLDPKGRFRGKIVSFRCSEEENAALDVAVKLSGLTKQDYIISRVTNRDIIVQPNPKVYKALKDQLAAVLAELKKNEGGEISVDLLDTIQLITKTLDGIKGGDNE